MDYPFYNLQATLDNGMTFTVQFGPAPGLPGALEDALAIAAAKAIQDFDWSSTGITPAVTSATVTLTRQDVESTTIQVA